MITIYDTDTWAKIADLWFNQDYSPVEIGQELSLSMDSIEIAIRLLDSVHLVIRQGMLERVKSVLDLVYSI